ncbi:MAG: hypothetical protein SFV15_15340 [Polyangiaceae bacterium]|nr:hypothetical protein [Polyangiaceae bacterium]
MSKQALGAIIALSSTGELLLNVTSNIPLSVLRRFSREAGLSGVLFVGTPLKNAETTQLFAALDDAAAEACAKLLARRGADGRQAPKNHGAAKIPPEQSRARSTKKKRLPT